MDKRWIVIFIILIVGISALYVIVNDSDRLGKAIDTIDNVIITFPADFKETDKTKTSAQIMNRNTGETIDIQLIKEKNKAHPLMKSKLNELNSSDDVKDLKNFTQNISNKKVYVITYQNVSEENPMNYSMYFVNKINKTFILTSFNYTDTSTQLKDVAYLIDTIRIDYKVKGD